MTNPTQTQVLLVVAVLASLLLSIDAASSSQSVTATDSISYSMTIPASLSGTFTSSFSPSYSTSATFSPSVGFTVTNTISTSLSLTTSITTSISYSITVSNTFTASCTNPVLQDRCAPQVTAICPFYTLRAGICPPPATSTGTSTYQYVITNNTGGIYTTRVTFPAGVTPQFPSSSISTNGFLHTGATFMFQVTQVNTDGSLGLQSNTLVKTLQPDRRDPSVKCQRQACNQFCGTVAGRIVCTWTLGTVTPIPQKRVVLEYLACYSTNNGNFLPVSLPSVRHNRTGFGKTSSVTLACQPTTLCFVKLILRYPRSYRGQVTNLQLVSKFGVICSA